MARPRKYNLADLAPGQSIRIAYEYPEIANVVQRRILNAARYAKIIITTGRVPGAIIVRRKP